MGPVRRFRQNMLFGLENDRKANNCFVNVVIQNIWHLNGFKFVLRDTILAASQLDPENTDPILFKFAWLLKGIKEGEESAVYSVAQLKHGMLTEMFGAGSFEWNEQADACEAFLLIL